MNPAAVLSKREEQMITGLVLGRCKKEIADELCVSTHTVETTIRNAMLKADAKKSTDLVVYWFLKHFSIPAEALPKSIIAFFFLILFVPFELSQYKEIVRSSRIRITEERTMGGRKSGREDYIIEF
jgi:DNA-binding CsgD family transcriptional regulator